MAAIATVTALVDGSIYAGSVCDHAAWIAGRTGASVDLLHVLGRRDTARTPSNLSGSIGLGERTALLEELTDLDARMARLSQQRGRAILEDAKARVAAAGIAEVGTRLRFGDIVEAVEEGEGRADMLVLGKRGEAADFARLHLGSNLERIVRTCRKPVFVAARAYRPVATVLIAFDGGPSSTKALDFVATSPLFAGLACRAVTVGASAEAGPLLADARASLARRGGDVRAEAHPGQPEEVIAAMVEAGGIDLLVMGAYGHTRLRNLIIGSTTTEMLRRCLIPVLLFR